MFNMERLLETRLEAAVNLRKCLGLPGDDTNAFRLVNSEGDRHVPLLLFIHQSHFFPFQLVESRLPDS